MRKRTSKMESTRKIVKDSVFFFFFLGQRRKSTPVVNAGAGGQRQKSTPVVNGLTWHWRVGDAWGRVGDAWGTRGAWDARGARGSVARVRRVGSWHAERVRARGSAWGRVGARGDALPDLWRRVAARGRVSEEPETSGGAYEVRSGRFWSQWTDRDEIYPMKVVLRQTETWR